CRPPGIPDRISLDYGVCQLIYGLVLYQYDAALQFHIGGALPAGGKPKQANAGVKSNAATLDDHFKN
ncbi:MAG: hypothetical protein AAFR90_13930, partial [Pseudomonadota bacterium]